ncbi:DUF202 domain-containing protein [Streptomyces sp. NPDC006296]|uniref:DUF202 domain-containing protein n=1 Tax=Streptomyces sp. NPDC006296 TaxID=3156746 RepID=UPI00339E1AD7
MTGPERDPGLQPERTRLAWRRTTLACTVVAVLGVRQALTGGVTGAAVLAVAASLLAWLGFLAVAHHRVTGLGAAEPVPLPPRHALAAVVCTLALAVCAAAMLF